jgi:hypothetical protein
MYGLGQQKMSHQDASLPSTFTLFEVITQQGNKKVTRHPQQSSKQPKSGALNPGLFT